MHVHRDLLVRAFTVDELLGGSVELVHGPGCPVCVTPLEMIDRAINLARRPDVTLVSYGDMLRVPGSDTDLLHVKAQGGDVRIVYSPTDAVNLARALPHRNVVFFAIGFAVDYALGRQGMGPYWNSFYATLGAYAGLCAHDWWLRPYGAYEPYLTIFVVVGGMLATVLTVSAIALR